MGGYPEFEVSKNGYGKFNYSVYAYGKKLGIFKELSPRLVNIVSSLTLQGATAVCTSILNWTIHGLLCKSRVSSFPRSKPGDNLSVLQNDYPQQLSSANSTRGTRETRGSISSTFLQRVA